jgi:zinc D-Ala-D-Ala carboxypeptidase
VNLTEHFTAGELNYQAAPFAARVNLEELARLLERARAIIGAPLRVTSGWRSAERNQEVGGSATSQHVDGSAADVVPVGLSNFDAYKRLRDAGALGWFGQVIVYPDTGHLHLSLPNRGYNGDVRLGLKTASGGRTYPTLTPELLARYDGASPAPRVGTAATVGLLVLAVGALLVLSLTA